MRLAVNVGNNQKLGKDRRDIASFSVTPIECCPYQTEACENECYDVVTCKRRKNVKLSRGRSYRDSLRPDFAERMIAQIRRMRTPIKIFRIHVGGDFYSKAYFLKWLEIVKALPHIQFYAFTKAYYLFRYKLPSNFVLIASVYYDEKRKPPKNAPKFYTVRKGDTGPGQHCAGSCENCGICPFITDGAEVWTEVH